jgi:hypothetical protein
MFLCLGRNYWERIDRYLFDSPTEVYGKFWQCLVSAFTTVRISGFYWKSAFHLPVFIPDDSHGEISGFGGVGLYWQSSPMISVTGAGAERCHRVLVTS